LKTNVFDHNMLTIGKQTRSIICNWVWWFIQR